MSKEKELSIALTEAFPKSEVIVTRAGARQFTGSVTSKRFAKMKPTTAAKQVNEIVARVCKKCTASISALAPATTA